DSDADNIGGSSICEIYLSEFHYKKPVPPTEGETNVQCEQRRNDAKKLHIFVQYASLGHLCALIPA
ncbi:hypothetical protein NPIL_161751, partial [Nephila pilipes]